MYIIFYQVYKSVFILRVICPFFPYFSYVIKEIASRVEEWAGKWDAVLDNINARGDVLSLLSDYANKTNNPTLLEAEFTSSAIDQYYEIISRLREEYGTAERKNIVNLFELWLKSKK